MPLLAFVGHQHQLMPLFLQVNKVKRVGDPICDVFGVQVFANRTLVALADGCNWGEKPKKGAGRESRRCLSIGRLLVEGQALSMSRSY